VDVSYHPTEQRLSGRTNGSACVRSIANRLCREPVRTSCRSLAMGERLLLGEVGRPRWRSAVSPVEWACRLRLPALRGSPRWLPVLRDIIFHQAWPARDPDHARPCGGRTGDRVPSLDHAARAVLTRGGRDPYPESARSSFFAARWFAMPSSCHRPRDRPASNPTRPCSTSLSRAAQRVIARQAALWQMDAHRLHPWRHEHRQFSLRARPSTTAHCFHGAYYPSDRFLPRSTDGRYA